MKTTSWRWIHWKRSVCCGLRVYAGQLDGEIPATIRGQQENPDAKVDASVS